MVIRTASASVNSTANINRSLSGVMGLFRFLSYGLAVVLSFIGVKMLISGHIHLPIELSLGIIVAVLATSVGLSLAVPKKPPDLKDQGGS